ncbi:MAG: tetratricopeptide repeat protein [Candidatus Eisenbacteria bacterium]
MGSGRGQRRHRFFIGNGPDANGAYAPPPGMEENRDLLGVETAREAVEKDDSEPSAFSFAQADRYWRQQAWAAISSDPGRAVGLFGRKLLLFFGQYEVPQIESFSYEKRYAAVLQTPLPGMAWLVALAALGLLLCAQDRIARWLGLSILTFAVGTALFFVTARFRLPVFPWLAVLGGAGIAEAVARVRRRTVGIRFAVGVVTACAVLALSSVNLLGVDQEASEGQYSFRQGVLAERNRRTDEAIGLYRDALARDPNLAKANVNLGTLLARKGQLAEGLPFLERGAQLDAGSGIALQNLGQAYQVMGREAEARAQFEKAVLAQPDLVSARESLAYLLYAAGDIKEARQSLQTILFQAPKGSPPSLRAGTLLAVMDERTDLVKQLTGPTHPGSSVDPVWWKHPGLLQADLALAQRRMDEARRGYQAAAQDPATAPYAQNVLEQMTESLGEN